MYRCAVALTGGIATGKSTVCKLFEARGYKIIDADKVAHEVLGSQKAWVKEHFGASYVDENGVDRKRLGALVFSDSTKRKALEARLHPLIRAKIESLSGELDRQKQPHIIDIPLFFETGAYPIEKVVVVYASRRIQLERLIERDGCSHEEAIKRIETQMDIEEKKARATWVIDNSTTLQALEKNFDKIEKQIAKELRNEG